jgi:prepilin-type N-terminal cleavage/methylation domain-containing protein
VRRGFSLVEVILAMTLSLVVTSALFFAFINSQNVAEHGIRTLDYIRNATILLEQFKQDIRASVHKTGAVLAKGPTAKLERHLGGKVAKVEYTFDAQNRCVVRTADGYKKTYGAGGNVGSVAFFACIEVPNMPGFYKIEVRFETKADPQRTGNYTFAALVNKRAQENEADVKWKYAFEE